MRVVFAGTPDFAVPALQTLLDSSHEISLVLTQPDRPRGRGMKLQQSPIKQLALQHRIPVYQPLTLLLKEAAAHLAQYPADVLVVVAYGLIIPQTVLDGFAWGGINIHASLLPRWRGAAPIQRAILAGDRETGITIMQMSAELDAGDILQQRALTIAARSTAQMLHDELAPLGAQMLLDTLASISHTRPQVQDATQVSYAEKLRKEEAPLDWHSGADQLSRQVRAFHPFPVAQAVYAGEVWRIWQADVCPEETHRGQPGVVLEAKHCIHVACGQGCLRLIELQRPNGKRLPVSALLAGLPVMPGSSFDAVQIVEA